MPCPSTTKTSPDAPVHGPTLVIADDLWVTRRALRAFIKLARINKSDPDPHPLVATLFYDHPPIRERLAMAD